jgi:xylulose-5-phosphate/fructose-6-phosphate phosphoketolase
MAERAAPLIDRCRTMLARHEAYIREHLEDMPEVRDWTWTEA